MLCTGQQNVTAISTVNNETGFKIATFAMEAVVVRNMNGLKYQCEIKLDSNVDIQHKLQNANFTWSSVPINVLCK